MWIQLLLELNWTARSFIEYPPLPYTGTLAEMKLPVEILLIVVGVRSPGLFRSKPALLTS